MKNSKNYSRMESEEAWQIIDYLVNQGFMVTQARMENQQLVLEIKVPMSTLQQM